MPAKRKRNLFEPANKEPFALSRSKLECWIKCPSCFYLDRRLGVKPPGMPSMTLNRAVDTLMKNEFDGYRSKQTPHPAFVKHGIEAVPLSHPDLDVWRSNFKGIKFLHRPTNLLISGAPDDILVADGKWAVLDFKGTASKQVIVALDTEYRQSYQRQVEIYSWLLKMNGHPVGKTAYLLFANASTDRPSLNGRLEFDMQLVEIEVKIDWIEPVLANIKKTLLSEVPPKPAKDCENCQYVSSVNEAVSTKSGRINHDP
jgi:CRISPR/Cas system-associated exonuclease Cas4 (RecB family)